MNRTVQITAILDRLNEGCLGDAEYCTLQATLLELEPSATRSPEADSYSDLQPPF